MKIHHGLFVCFLSAVWDRITSITIRQKKEGTNFTAQWHFSSSDGMKFFCRRECKEGDVLIKTPENRAQSGRYRVEYKNTAPAGGFLSVTITNLNKSDSGRYRFGVGRSVLPVSYGEFDIKVLDALQDGNNEKMIHTEAEGEKVTRSCIFSSSKSTKFFCKNDCKEGNILIETADNRAQNGRYSIRYAQESAINSFVLRVTITNLTRSDSGRYTCGSGETLSSASFQKFEISVTDGLRLRSGRFSSAPPEAPEQFTVSSDVSHPGFLLPVVICVSLVVVLLAAVLLVLFRRKRSRRSEGRNKECVYENCPPVSTCEDPIYQNLDPASKHQD